MKYTKNIPSFAFQSNAWDEFKVNVHKKINGYAVYFMDAFFKEKTSIHPQLKSDDILLFVDPSIEPKTSQIDSVRNKIIEEKGKVLPEAIIAIGGGCTLDTGKAVSNLLTNGGKSEDYQGWDLVKVPGVYKIGIPTISGTGAEASRTCVMTNTKSGLKLGMNSDFTLYDELVLDPDLTKTVARDQYFYTGMDTFIHCLESLGGSYRHPVGDAYSEQAMTMSLDVFQSEDMMSDENRSKLMVASYLGGCAIANSFVGVVHPFSAGLSVVLGVHHGIGNCITMTAMQEFYPKEVDLFFQMAEKQGVEIPKGIAKNLTEDQYEQLYQSTVIHEKPLTNALGPDFKQILTKEKVIDLFRKM